MIGWHKLRREAFRIIRQIAYGPKLLGEYVFATHWHDRVLRPRQVQVRGNIPLGEKIAIYLIFPRHGVFETHLDSLRYIISRGYSPVTVSNLSLSQTDREKLKELSYRLLERENFGYDFGGYREGILSVAGDLGKLSRLVLLNDSCWFPLPGANDWLALSETSGLDYVGAASNYGIKAPNIERFFEIDWRYDDTRRSFHYCSFALSLSSRIASDPNFIRFWRSYRLSNSKSRTVRRGEIGLTQWAIREGYSHGSTFNIDRLDHNLAALDRDRLLQIATDLIIPENLVLNEKLQQLIGGADPKIIHQKTLEKLVLTAVASQGMAYSIPYYLFKYQGYSFLKKSPIRLDPRASRKTLELVERFGSSGENMKQEAEAMYKEKSTTGRLLGSGVEAS